MPDTEKARYEFLLIRAKLPSCASAFFPRLERLMIVDANPFSHNNPPSQQAHESTHEIQAT